MQSKREITTRRLKLRILSESDLEPLWQEANHWEIADTMISVPFPFEKSHAREWIERAGTGFKTGREFNYGIFEASTQKFVGYVTLRALDFEHNHAELSFWISISEWGKGFATEACRAVVRLGFNILKINRIHAYHMVRNPSSGKVLEKIGFKEEGFLRECVIKWDTYEDVIIRAILKKDWD